MEIPFHRVLVGEEERREMMAVLDSGWLTTGPRCHQFEEDMCRYLGRKYAVAVNSGTASLHLSVATSKAKPGQGILVPSHTFAATAEVVVAAGCQPILVESDPLTHNLDLDWLETFLQNPSIHPLVRRGHKLPELAGLMPMHYAGLMVDMERAAQLAHEYNLDMVEDAAHTLPAFRPDSQGGKISIGDLSPAACLSFYPTKNITTGEGGMVLTDDEDRANLVRMISLHGLDRQAWKRFSKEGSWYTEIQEAGLKYNMTDLAAAMGIHQLARCDDLWQRRKKLAASYLELLEGCPGLELPNGPEAVQAMGGPQMLEGHSWHIYPIMLTQDAKMDREEFIAALRQKDIVCAVHWMPLHLHPYYQRMGYEKGDFPQAEAGFEGLISLPFYVSLTQAQVEYLAQTIRELLEG